MNYLKVLKEDGKVYVPFNEYTKFEKQLKSAKVKFHAFDRNGKILVELDI